MQLVQPLGDEALLMGAPRSAGLGARAPTLIKTLRNEGYVLAAAVEAE
jgi:hypothetical protein